MNLSSERRTLSNPLSLRRRTAKLSVGFILARHFTLCAFANFIDVLRLAADEGDRSRQILCDWTILSDDMAGIPSSCGVTVQSDERLGDPSRFDYIVVVGGLVDGIDRVSNAYMDYLQRAAVAGIALVGICSGAFILHRAGLMAGYKCCVSWFHSKDFLDQFAGLNPVSDQIFIVDRDRLTCSGGVSSAHLAAYLVEQHIGRSSASKSLHIMIIDHVRRGEEPQPGIPLEFETDDPIVKRALIIAQHNLETPLSIADVAERLGISKRQLERRFDAAFQLSPKAAFLDIRLAFARHLLEQTDRSVMSISLESGFCDSSHMRRQFRRRFGLSPRQMRAEFSKDKDG